MHKYSVLEVLDVLEVAVSLSNGSKYLITNAFGVARNEIQMLEAVNPAAALGSIKSEKKAAAARENGKKGGRPVTKITAA